MPSSLVCVDASLVVGLVSHPERERVRALWAGWQEKRAELAAPSLLLYEVTNAIFQYERQSLIRPATADRFLHLANALPIRLYDEAELHRDAMRLARRFSLPATYDAHYLALAEQLDAPFWTLDRRLVRAVETELERVTLAV